MDKRAAKRQALRAIEKAACLMASASHDYEIIECDYESNLTYNLMCEVRRLHARLSPKRRKKVSKQ